MPKYLFTTVISPSFNIKTIFAEQLYNQRLGLHPARGLDATTVTAIDAMTVCLMNLPTSISEVHGLP